MVFNAILLQIIKCGKILAIVLLLLFSFLSVLHISYTTVQCYIVYFLRFFELHMVEWSRRQCICILGHQGYVMMRHFWLLQEKALSDIGVCVLEYRLSWAYILPISLPPNFHFCCIVASLSGIYIST